MTAAADLATFKANVALPALVSETHPLDRTHRVLCPVHDDNSPSCVVYADHVFCFACRWHADAIGWLQVVHNLTFLEAVSELERRVGSGFYSQPECVPEHRPAPKHREFRPVAADVLIKHRVAAARLDSVPLAMQGRGFTLADLRRLNIAAVGQDAALPITDPTGRVIALKRRYSRPRNNQRYVYLTTGCNSPAWCSQDFLERDVVLVIEGELNGMAAWLARPDLGVMAAAGCNGPLYIDALKDRVAYVYGDADVPGQQARDKWAQMALDAEAKRVFTLEPLRSGDFCDLAGTQGRDALRAALS